METRGPENRRGTAKGWFWVCILSFIMVPVVIVWGFILFLRRTWRDSSAPKVPAVRPLEVSKETMRKIIHEDGQIKGDRLMRSLKDEEIRRGP